MNKVIDVCNERAKEMELHYDKLCKRKKELENEIEKINEEICDLRKREVDNVCDYVRTYTRLGVLNPNDIDNYLCHCQNMLNGNLDGTYLTFSKEKKENE